MKRRSLLFLGTFLAAPSGSRAISEDIGLRLKDLGWQVTFSSRRMGRFTRLADTLLTVFRNRETCDAAHLDVYGGKALYLADATSWMLRKCGIRFAATLHGGSLPAMASIHPGRISRVLSRADRVVSPSGYLKEALSPLGFPIEVIPNPVQVSSYGRVTTESSAMRLVWLRAFHKIYTPTMAIDCLAKVRTRHPGATLVMVGADKDGSLSMVRRHAIRLGLLDSVNLVPGIPKAEVPALLASGEIFLNTTEVDNTPVSVIEAMASGLAVVSTRVGGVPWLIRDGENGILVPSRDSEAMAMAVIRLLEDPGLKATISTNARAHAAAMDWSQVVPQWSKLFHELAR